MLVVVQSVGRALWRCCWASERDLWGRQQIGVVVLVGDGFISKYECNDSNDGDEFMMC